MGSGCPFLFGSWGQFSRPDPGAVIHQTKGLAGPLNTRAVSSQSFDFGSKETKSWLTDIWKTCSCASPPRVQELEKAVLNEPDLLAQMGVECVTITYHTNLGCAVRAAAGPPSSTPVPAPRPLCAHARCSPHPHLSAALVLRVGKADPPPPTPLHLGGFHEVPPSPGLAQTKATPAGLQTVIFSPVPKHPWSLCHSDRHWYAPAPFIHGAPLHLWGSSEEPPVCSEASVW